MRETATLEFKQQLSKSYLKTVSAYANYGTGKIIFGIADDGTPVGLADPQDTCLRIEHASFRAVHRRGHKNSHTDGA